MVAARRRPVATHAPVGAAPTALIFLFYFFECDGGLFYFFECDGGSAAEVSDLSEMMAALPPRPKASFTYAFTYLRLRIWET
jgi:hypothetical protein